MHQSNIPPVHQIVTEMCTHVHISVTEWWIMGYLSNALWDLGDRSIDLGIYANIMVADSLAIGVARSSAAIILAVWNRDVIYVHWGWISLHCGISVSRNDIKQKCVNIYVSASCSTCIRLIHMGYAIQYKPDSEGSHTCIKTYTFLENMSQMWLIFKEVFIVSPGPTFIKQDQLNPRIKDQMKITLLSTISPLQLPNFVSCGRDKPSHRTQNLVTVGTKLWIAERFLVDLWSLDQADLVW